MVVKSEDLGSLILPEQFSAAGTSTAWTSVRGPASRTWLPVAAAGAASDAYDPAVAAAVVAEVEVVK